MDKNQLIQNIMDLRGLDKAMLEQLSYTTLLHLESDLSDILKQNMDALTYEDIQQFRKNKES